MCRARQSVSLKANKPKAMCGLRGPGVALMAKEWNHMASGEHRDPHSLPSPCARGKKPWLPVGDSVLVLRAPGHVGVDGPEVGRSTPGNRCTPCTMLLDCCLCTQARGTLAKETDGLTSSPGTATCCPCSSLGWLCCGQQSGARCDLMAA